MEQTILTWKNVPRVWVGFDGIILCLITSSHFVFGRFGLLRNPHWIQFFLSLYSLSTLYRGIYKFSIFNFLNIVQGKIPFNKMIEKNEKECEQIILSVNVGGFLSEIFLDNLVTRNSWLSKSIHPIYTLSRFIMISKRDQNRIKELKKEIPFYGELSTSESKEMESYKRLVVELKKELESLEKKVNKGKKN